MEDNVKEIALQRSESYGFGFSIIGGLGSELPPVICDIVEDSPAAHCKQLQAGDVIVAVNGMRVAAYTTKEVLKCLRLSGPSLNLVLQEDSGVRERVAHYLSCSTEDADSLRDVISQRDLTGVDEIIVRCPASPHSPRPYSGTPSPNMPRPGERKLNGSSRTSPAHKSRIPSHSTGVGYRPGGNKVQQNGVDSSNGKSSLDEDCPPSKRQDRGFETFVMTGDMIIRTSTTSSHSKTESPRKPASDKRKGSGDGRSLKSPQSPVKSPQNDTPKDPKAKSRIPKPGRVSSPKQTTSQIPRPGWSEKKLNKSANYNSSTDSESTEPGVVSPTAGHIENLELVNNNVIEPMSEVLCHSAPMAEVPCHSAPMAEVPYHNAPMAEVPYHSAPMAEVPYHSAPMAEVSCHSELMTDVPWHSAPMAEVPCHGAPMAEVPCHSAPMAEVPWHSEPMAEVPWHSAPIIEDVPQDTGPPPRDPVEIEYYSHYPPPAYTIAPELDIPPDDISSEDDNYKNMDVIMNLDDLPPPPDELLHDYPEKVDTRVPDRLESVIPATTALLSEGCLSRQEGQSAHTSIEGNEEQNRLVGSKSAEKIPSRSNSQNSSGVRTSKSHENYLESQNMMGVTMVDIDLEENLASSVDVLHYHDKLGSAEHVTETSRSLENSPERTRHADRHHVPTFIRMEETHGEPVVPMGSSCLRHPVEATLLEERPVSTSSTASVNSDLSRELVVGLGQEAGSTSQEELVRNGLLLERMHARQSRELEDVIITPDLQLMVNNHNNHLEATEDADSSKSETNSTGGHSETPTTTPSSNPSHHQSDSPAQPSGPAGNPRGAGPPSSGSPPGPLRPRSDTMGSEGSESDADSLYHQPSKDVDRPSAQRLAKRLYHLDGFRKGDVFRHLSKKNEFAQFVGEEYLKYFDFTGETLDLALRNFLKRLTLTGETQERERVLAHFSRHYVDCNPGTYHSEDACHTLTCALMLLNTDLHGQNIGRKMTLAEFIENLADLNDGDNFDREILKQLYNAIKNEPLECEFEEEVGEFGDLPVGQMPAMQDMSRYAAYNPFLEVPDPSKATEYKKGYVMRKCCLDPDGRKTALGKRGWKMFYAILRDTILYLYKDEHVAKKSSLYDSMGNAVRIHHALATRANDYTKKQHVFRVVTSDWAQYLFQTSDHKDCTEWIDTINFVAASLSAPPLPGGVGSQRKFQRPLMPSSLTKLNMREQLTHHEQRVLMLEQDLQEHQICPPQKGAKSRIIQEYQEKEACLEFELQRFKTYTFLLQSKMSSYPELEPSLVEVAIGEVDEPPSSPPGPSGDEKRGRPVQRSMSDSTLLYSPSKYTYEFITCL